MAQTDTLIERGISAGGNIGKHFIDSLTIPVTVVIALFIVKVVNPVSYDPDFYWHLKTGEYIVTTLSLPYADVFSYTAYGKDWVLHEWLSEVLFYVAAQLGGLKGVWIFVAALYAATFFVVYRFCGRLLGNSEHALALALLFFAPFVAFATPRPQIFTYLLFAVYLSILLDWKYSGNVRVLRWLPAIMVLWVNLHGAAIVGVVLVSLFVVTEGAVVFFGLPVDTAKKTAWKKLALWASLAIFATLANPRFIDYWVYPFYVVNLSVATSVINEWKSPDFHSLYFRYFLALFLGFFAVLAYSRRKLDITEFAIPVFFIVAGFSSVRHLPLACIAALPFFAVSWKGIDLRGFERLCSHAWSHNTAFDRKIDDRYVPYLNALLLCIVATAMIYHQRHSPNENVMETMMPVKAADFLASSGISGRMFNEYGEGGYLIYRLYPKQKVFIDGRADMYGDAFIKEYLAIATGAPEWKQKLDRYAIDYALIPRDLPLRQLLLAGKEFKLVYDDPGYSVLVRDIPRFSELGEVRTDVQELSARK